MPIYEYDCAECGGFCELRALDEHSQPAPCPRCGALVARAISAPRLAVLSATQRRAHTTNERSAHEPRRSGAAHRHGPACGCGKKTTSGTGDKAPMKGFANRRPWMISH